MTGTRMNAVLAKCCVIYTGGYDPIMTVSNENVYGGHVILFGVILISSWHYHFPLAGHLEQLFFVCSCVCLRLCSCAGYVRLCSCAKGDGYCRERERTCEEAGRRRFCCGGGERRWGVDSVGALRLRYVAPPLSSKFAPPLYILRVAPPPPLSLSLP